LLDTVLSTSVAPINVVPPLDELYAIKVVAVAFAACEIVAVKEVVEPATAEKDTVGVPRVAFPTTTDTAVLLESE
jgi:hypothetical protein